MSRCSPVLGAFLLFPMRLSFPLRSRRPRPSSWIPTLGPSFAFRSPALSLAPVRPVQIQKEQPRRLLSMNAQELSQYLADAPPSVVRLEIEKHFTALSDSQKRYAHFISQ